MGKTKPATGIVTVAGFFAGYFCQEKQNKQAGSFY